MTQSHPRLGNAPRRLAGLLTAALLCGCGAGDAASALDAGADGGDTGPRRPTPDADAAVADLASPDAAARADAPAPADAAAATDPGPAPADARDAGRTAEADPADTPADGPVATEVTADAAPDGPADARGEADAVSPPPLDLVAIPAGTFEMGDHSGLGSADPNHPSDELPLHSVTLDAFAIGRYETTAAQYADYLNAAWHEGTLAVVAGVVTLAGSPEPLFETHEAAAWSPIGFDGTAFEVRDGRESHPVVGVRWTGAAAFANWLSRQAGLTPCHDLATGTVDLTAACFRLPTEAEWEYAALGGRRPHPVYPWGDELDPLRANWPSSNDPWESGPDPKTTPVGFFDGSLRQKADFGWPAAVERFQTHDGRNGLGLYDLAGNAWEWVVDWYGRDYYATSPAMNPPGPTAAAASPMPDGEVYRGMRGGNWFNGTTPARQDGHSRVANRDPSYFRGPGDPNGPWFHVGLRLVRAHVDRVAKGAFP